MSNEQNKGSAHYVRCKIQPFDLIKAMEPTGIPFVEFCRGNIIKYAFRKKGGREKMIEDLKKAAHYCEEAAGELLRLGAESAPPKSAP